MIVFRRKFIHSYGFRVVIYTLVGIVLGASIAFDNICGLISFSGVIVILPILMLIFIGTSFYIIIDKDVVLIKNIVPFVSIKINMSDVERCKMIRNTVTGIYHIAFFKKNKYAIYYPLGMVSNNDIENIAALLIGRDIDVFRRDRI